MEINAQDVIDRLTAKIGKLEGELAVAQVQIDALSKNSPSEPVEGEVV